MSLYFTIVVYGSCWTCDHCPFPTLLGVGRCNMQYHHEVFCTVRSTQYSMFSLQPKQHLIAVVSRTSTVTVVGEVGAPFWQLTATVLRRLQDVISMKSLT